MRPLDIAVIAAYCAAVIAFGLVLAGRQRDASDYFLGHRGLPWWALMLSIVATETSALTVISFPGIAARTNLAWIQVTFGYLVGRIGVAAYLLPGYFDGTQDTAYQRLERRFGRRARRAASALFLGTRALADCVRIFATAIPLAIMLYGTPTPGSLAIGILAIGLVTVIYTWVGGLRAVVWVDVIQLGVYLVGGLATLVVATHLAGGVGAFARAWDQGKLVFLDFRPSFRVLYTFWGGLVGGALIAGASHGTDHLIVQRLLAARGLRDAQRALIGSGIFIVLQIGLFLLVGTSLWLAGADDGRMRSDAIYPTFVIHQLPAGLAGLVVAGILAAAMSSHASAVNSLASASTLDFYAPITGRQDPAHLLWVGRWLTLVWTAVLVAGAMAFRDQNTPVVQLALSITSLTYGSLLGTYLLGGWWRRARERDVIIAMSAGVLLMAPIVLGAVIPQFPARWRWLPGLAWPWYVPLGTAVTVAVGVVASWVGGPGRAWGTLPTGAGAGVGARAGTGTGTETR
jgi:solute:Na+ symporter, SSS family